MCYFVLIIHPENERFLGYIGWLVELGFDATLTAKVISWRVGAAHIFPGFLTPVLKQLFFPKPPTTFVICFLGYIGISLSICLSVGLSFCVLVGPSVYKIFVILCQNQFCCYCIETFYIHLSCTTVVQNTFFHHLFQVVQGLSSPDLRKFMFNCLFLSMR